MQRWICAVVQRIIGVFRTVSVRAVISHDPIYPVIMHVYTSIQIHGSSIQQTDQRPAHDKDGGTIVECNITRVPIDRGTHCDIVHATGEHVTCHIRGTAHTWVFALVVGPMCKTLRIRMNACISDIVPMYIRLPLQGTIITIQSMRDRFVVRTCMISPRILPYVVCATVGSGTLTVLPTLDSQLVVNSWNHSGLIRTWECLIRTDGLARVQPSLNTSAVSVMSTKLFESMHKFNLIFHPDALYTTYPNLARFLSIFNVSVTKTRKQSEEVIRLKKLLAVHGYITSAKTELELDLGSMLCSGSDLVISYD
jgi:hypothetical protein